MIMAYQDRSNLYLILDLMRGGDLRFHISRKRRFTQKQASKTFRPSCWAGLLLNRLEFLIVNIIIGLEYIHQNGILHRDIKPENLVLDEQGYVRITDFGISRYWRPDNSSDTSGTPGYMAPEVMCR